VKEVSTEKEKKESEEKEKGKDKTLDVEIVITPVVKSQNNEEIEQAVNKVRIELTEQFNAQLKDLIAQNQLKEKQLESESQKKINEVIDEKKREFANLLESHLKEVKLKYSFEATTRQDKLISFQKELEQLTKAPSLKIDPRIITARHLKNLRLQLALRDIDYCLLSAGQRSDNSNIINDTILLQHAWNILKEQDDPIITTAIKSVPNHVVDSHISNIPDLIQSFNAVETSVFQAIYSLDHPSIWGQMFGTIFTLLTFRQHELVSGNQDSSRLSRAGYYLEQGKLLPCLNELESLTEHSKQTGEVQKFLKQLNGRLTLEQAISVIKGRAALLALAE